MSVEPLAAPDFCVSNKDMTHIATNLTLKAIDYYQKELSHRKRSRCAHGALYKGLTCSAYSKERIKAVGFTKGMLDTFNRFRECYKASIILQQESSSISESDDYKKMKNEKNKTAIDGCFAALIAHDAACCLFSIFS